jgi:O-antigen/teichoic acid export membrane protein
MQVYAYIGVSDAVLKLGVVYLITISTFDKLITLGMLNLCISFGMYVFYNIYCKKQFSEYNFGLKVEKQLLREMIGFSTWSMIGSTAFMLKNHGVNVLINIFFGPVVNAANAIAYQVNNAIVQFSTNFTMALNPQIIKSYAANEKTQMKNLIFRGGRISFFLLMILSIPILLETDIILKVWLINVPQYAVDLTRLILILALIESFAITISTSIQATGKIKYYQIFVGCIYLLNFPIAYIFYKLGAEPTMALIISIILALINVFTRLYLMSRYLSINYRDYLRDVMLISTIVMIISLIFPTGIHHCMHSGLQRLLLVILVSCISSATFIYILGLEKYERKQINSFIYKKIRR